MKDDKARLIGAPHAPARATEHEAEVSGLECRVGKAPIVVPVEHVAQIVEFQLSPLPLTRRWVSGVGLYDDRLVMTVGLSPVPTRERRSTKGILLAVPGSKVAWALEVQEVLVLVRATVIEQKKGAPRVGDLPPWIGRARTNDGRQVAWIDVPDMVSNLTTPARSVA